ncbi:MAG: prepilin-type N-terminal cleavage/methylation domain-containing protein [Candidatus Omnitrophica bacterium]|nr:prepilin-type N-terminal cleavage/methylation domain-containing protein [Candidatus Omnitrophota bacterium]
MMNKKGFTLTELIVALIVSIVLMMTVGAIASIGNDSYSNLMKEANIYNDVYFGLDLIQSLSHKATTISVDTVNKTLTIDKLVFSVSKKKITDTVSDFIYTNTLTNAQTILFSGVGNLSFVPSLSADGKIVTASLSGTKSFGGINTSKAVTFNVSTSAMRRN